MRLIAQKKVMLLFSQDERKELEYKDAALFSTGHEVQESLASKNRCY